MSSLFSAPKREKPVAPPTEDKAERARAEELRRNRSARGFRSTLPPSLVSQMSTAGLKTSLGA